VKFRSFNKIINVERIEKILIFYILLIRFTDQGLRNDQDELSLSHDKYGMFYKCAWVELALGWPFMARGTKRHKGRHFSQKKAKQKLQTKFQSNYPKIYLFSRK